MASGSETIGIIGSGSAGLAAARNLLAEGFDVELLERQTDLGGNWNYALPYSRVYRSTHMISSKSFTQYPDHPMPEAFPPYPHHSQVLEYLRSYAERFGLIERIRLGVEVQRCEPAAGGAGWRVECSGGQERSYRTLVIATGHHWSPKTPVYPGQFDGQSMHSAAYKTPEIFAGKRVLIVGGGNSGCDIAVEAAQSAAVTYHSTRRGYYYIPKFLFGMPSDRAGDLMHTCHAPLWLRRLVTKALLRVTVGPSERVGLPRPDHRLFETHPIVNTLLPYYVGQGDIRPKPDIAALDGAVVRFADGSRETVDLIVYATGYNIEIPFIDPTLLHVRNGRPELYLNVFAPDRDDLFVIGMIQPDSGIFGLMHWQAAAMGKFLTAVREQRPTAEWFRRQRAHGHGTSGGPIRYLASDRHSIEVEHWSYRKALMRLVKRLSS